MMLRMSGMYSSKIFEYSFFNSTILLRTISLTLLSFYSCIRDKYDWMAILTALGAVVS